MALKVGHILLPLHKKMTYPNYIKALLLLILLTSCTAEEIHNYPHPRGMKPERELGPRTDNAQVTKSDTCIYSLGIEYPTDYDWRRDPLYGNVSCKLVVFAGQERLAEIDAGPESLVQPYPELNRICGGHLYSETVRDGKTILSKDGKLLFSHEGEERLVGFLIKASDIYTLGQSKSGEGFSFRRNGEKILSRDKGVVLGGLTGSTSRSGALQTDGEEVIFCYSEQLAKEECWYMVRNGLPERLSLPSDVVRVLDVKQLDGKVHIAAATVSSQGRVVHIFDNRRILMGSDRTGNVIKTLLGCNIFSSDGVVFLNEKHLLVAGNRSESCLWLDDGTLVRSGEDILDFWVSGGKISYLCSDRNGVIKSLQSGAYKTVLNDESYLTGSESVCVLGGSAYLLAHPLQKELSPYLWENGKRLALPINGFLFYIDAVVT